MSQGTTIIASVPNKINMQLSDIIIWAGAISWLVAMCGIISVVAKYQIKYGIIRSTIIEFNENDKKRIKLSTIGFVIGVFLFISAIILR